MLEPYRKTLLALEQEASIRLKIWMVRIISIQLCIRRGFGEQPLNSQKTRLYGLHRETGSYQDPLLEKLKTAWQ